ncbi:MAG: Flp pilus assembly complex ATPase component TadA [candidate division WS1 bacterium]|nr:Flp pilus assembly complex ATPase component TadA [candidate division WS1 bacterium]
MRRRRAHTMIGQMLIGKGLISPDQLDDALKAQEQTAARVGQILVDLGHLEKRPLYETLSEQMNVPFVDLSATSPDPKVALLLDRKTAEENQAVAVGRGDGTIRVAMAEPDDVMAIDALRMILQVTIEPMLADPGDIERTIRQVYKSGDGAPRPAKAAAAVPSSQAAIDMKRITDEIAGSDALGVRGEEEEVDDSRVQTDRIADITDEAPVIRLTKIIISRAIEERSSDIHVEPFQDRVRVRYRIDGVLHEIMPLPKFVHAPLVSRLKIMSGMNIAERRVPQDGRIHVRHANKDYDLRASVIPTTLGEKFVLRILDKGAIQIGMDNLGLTGRMMSTVERLILQPNGMLLSTGPTGSGKTTTQYCILNRINTVDRNIITIEDPVEYELDGLGQVHVNRKAGLTFAIALKYFLRQDPDIILVGEIRDLETSEIAIQAALTGHLVLSTLHTNDAPSTVTRLVDMGVEPFLIASSVIGSLSQRLARKICDECREEYQPPKESLLSFGFDPDDPDNDGVKFYHGVGCGNCRETGYRGRIGIFEMMEMNREIGELIVKRASAGQIKEAALAAGMITLAMDGMEKVRGGITTVEELTRVVFTAGAT